MKLTSCPRCERHVLVEAASCPFCGTRLGTTSALGLAMATMLAAAGLSIGCGGDDTGDTNETVANTQGPTTEGPTAGGTTTSEPIETDAGGNDYAGPDTSISAGPTDASGGEEAESTGGTTGDTETDTGDSTGVPGTDSGGQDYAGAGPE